MTAERDTKRTGYPLHVATSRRDDALLEIPLASADAPAAPGLAWLGGDFDFESWCAPDSEIRAIVLREPDDPEGDAAGPAERVYRRLIAELEDSAFGYPLRLWNYLPAINAGDGDGERYRRFCLGRGRALTAAGLDDARMCAATAIGGDRPVMQLVALCGRNPGLSIENPRQVSAWNYPRRYGPRQPAFARATAVPLAPRGTGLLISGTASVVGHATAHPGDAGAQTDEAASNIEALLAHAAAATGDPGLAAFGEHSLARVYVRRPGDWPGIRERLGRRWPALRLCGLRGDICRSDLMVEIEAWHPTAGLP